MTFPAQFNLSSLNGTNGFAINGINANDISGNSVSSAGDINGDGFDDLIIGASYADPNGSFSGQSYVVFGKSGGFSSSLNLSTLNGTNGFALNGINGRDISGNSVSSAGDINGDGFDDLIIGARGASPNGISSSGQSYVVFGKSSGFSASLNLSTLNGTNGFAINGINSRDYSGFSVSSAGDVNGDGFDDLIIGAFGASPNGFSSGQSYVVFGKSSGFGARLNLSTLNGTNGFIINGINSVDESGFSVSSAGDINGDGFDDLIIGARYASPNGISGSGQSYVVFGKSSGFGARLNLSTLNGTNGFALNGINSRDESGFSVSSAGDINGDGFDDLIIGTLDASPNGISSSGQSYVVFGKSSGFSASLNLSTLNGTNGFAINGINSRDYSGSSVSSAGDVNGDGFDDLIIGALDASPNGFRSGQSYVVFGKSSGFSSSLNLSTLNGTNGFALNGINANDISGSSVSSAGDVNGDGFDDLIIGAFRASPNGYSSGQSYVVFGQGTFTLLPSITLAVSPSSVLEDGTPNLIYTFTRTGSLTNPLTVNYTIGGTATNGVDYSNIGTSVTFLANSATATVIVDPTTDTTIEPDETVALTLASNAAYIIGTTTAVTGTITNDDGVLPSITLAVSPVSVLEDGTPNLIYTFTRTGSLTNPLTVNYTIGGTATNGTDYGTLGTSVTFLANSATATVIVDPTTDTVVEPDETVALTLASNAAYIIGTTTPVTGTITNDDVALPTVTLSVSPVSVLEDGTPTLIYTFTRTGSLTNPLTVNYTIEGTATNGVDYATLGTSVTFLANSATATVIVDPTADTLIEPDETVVLTLASNAAYIIGTTTPVTGTITNDDVLPSITLAVSPASVLEDGTPNLIYTFTRTGSLTNPLTVNYTIGGTSTNGVDYSTIGTSVTFLANSATATVIVDPTTDTTIEPDETVVLTLASNAAYIIGTTTPVTGTITNDDVLPSITLAVSPASVLEDGTPNLIYTFTRTGSLTNPLTVNYTIGGTSTNGVDYSTIGQVSHS